MEQGKTGSGGYTVLARRYRSREFDELIGQEPIARTLTNAIATNRVAHAYLFCGTRGVGKTSAARIFAKALNATDDLSESEAIANAILRGDDLDVIEIDGASNRGVQEARDLIAGAGLSPARCQYKIYIIDEVHMLTKEAFNALLKTMEEPPGHVKFILCTTDPQKVPATIQSRCQRFDFRAIPTSKIGAHLREILTKEGIDADDEVVMQVARLGNGSMRDALSLLDRLLAAGEARLTSALMEQMLGLPDQQLVVELMDAIVEGDGAAALERGAEVLSRGSSIEQVLEMIAEHLRMMLVVRTVDAQSEFLDVSTEMRERVAQQAEGYDVAALVHLIALCDATIKNVHGSATARPLFDAVLVRMCLAERFADSAALLTGEMKTSGSTTTKTTKKKSSAGKKKEVAAAADPPRSPAIGDRVGDVPCAAGDASGPIEHDSGPGTRDPIPTTPGAASPTPSVTEIKPGAASFDGPALWTKVCDAASGSPADEARTEYLSLESFDGETLRLSIDPDGASMAAYLTRSVDALIDQVHRATGQRVRIELIEPEQKPAAPKASQSALSEARSLPLVTKAMEIFEADVTDVQPTRERGED